MVQINGENCNAGGVALLDYLKHHGYDPRVVAVERNEEIVPKDMFSSTILADGDVIEIVKFMGGGC